MTDPRRQRGERVRRAVVRVRVVGWLALLVGVLVGVLVGGAGVVAEDGPGPAHRLIVGWDDAVVCCGPGTDPSMDSPQAVERMVKRWKARGIEGVYWRVDEAMLPPEFLTRWKTDRAPSSNYLFERAEQTLRAFPVLETLLAAAKQEGLQVWAWYPTLYSNGAPQVGPGFTHPWGYENAFATQHPEILSVDRAGKRHYMVWEYAYPEARRAKVAEFVRFAKDYGFRRFVACLRTEAAQMQPAPQHADQFGFNAPVVEEMKRRHGVDILTDPRFDWTAATFDLRDPMLESWRRLRGEHLTQLYRELREALVAVDPAVEIAVQIPGDRAGTCLGNWILDWRRWIDEGLVQELVVPVVLDGYEGYGAQADPARFGYIHGRVTPEEVRAYARTSRHPEVRVIEAGGPASGFGPRPAAADGWRLDAWPDLWALNMAQRWEQWERDYREFGHIRFLDQSFDAFPENDNGYGGGFGDFCYRPDLRAAPGYWEQLGRGDSALPYAQGRVRRGAAGRALTLTRSADATTNLTVRHHGRPDRSGYPFPGDTAISTGACTLELWVLRPTAEAGFTVFLTEDQAAAERYAVGLYVAPGEEGLVHYRNAGQHVASGVRVGVGRWHRLTLHVDLERHVYVAEVAEGRRAAQTVCRDVPYAPTLKAFNMVEVSPQGATGSIFHLDDVSLTRTPSHMRRAPGRAVLLDDGFEGGAAADGPTPWRIVEPPGGSCRVDRDISFGSGVASLRMRGSGGHATATARAAPALSGGPILIDLDMLPRGDGPDLAITPLPAATGTDEIGFAIHAGEAAAPVFDLRARAGRWHCRLGEVETATQAAVAWDAWHRVQLQLDTRSRTARLLVQVLGEAPRLLYEGSLAAGALPSGRPLSLDLFCLRQAARTDGPAFDNVRITR